MTCFVCWMFSFSLSLLVESGLIWGLHISGGTFCYLPIEADLDI